MCVSCSFSFSLHHSLVEWVVNFSFLTDQEFEAQRGQEVCPRSQLESARASLLKYIKNNCSNFKLRIIRYGMKNPGIIIFLNKVIFILIY